MVLTLQPHIPLLTTHNYRQPFGCGARARGAESAAQARTGTVHHAPEDAQHEVHLQRTQEKRTLFVLYLLNICVWRVGDSQLLIYARAPAC